MSVALNLHGVRGSRPTHRLDLLKYGGNSTSIEFATGEGFYLFLDGGSGLVNRGREIGLNSEHSEFHFIITHTHWDHLLGLPFFEPLHNPKNQFTFYASEESRKSFTKLFLTPQRRQNMPLPPSYIKAKISVRTIVPGEVIQISPNTKIESTQLNHQGMTLGYSIQNTGQKVCIITDNAPIENGNYMGFGMADQAKANPQLFEKQFNNKLVSFIKNADTVVYDTHFKEENLKPDWGHSTPQIALDFCIKASVKRLILFHHAPEDKDKDVEAKLESISKKARHHGIEVAVATEGATWNHP